MSEKNIWLWLKKANRAGEVKLWRVENRIGVGEPDVTGFIKSYGTVYLELKACDRPKHLTSKIPTKARPAQKIWHSEMTALGSTCHFILLGLGTSKYLIPGSYAEVFNDWTGLDLEPWHVPCKSADELLKLLTSRYPNENLESVLKG